MQHYVMLQRNLIYTALTRARKLAYSSAPKRAQLCDPKRHERRPQTSLIEKLRRVTDGRERRRSDQAPVWPFGWLCFSVFWLLGAACLPVVQDEAYYALWSRFLGSSYFDHPPLVALIAATSRLLPGVAIISGSAR